MSLGHPKTWARHLLLDVHDVRGVREDEPDQAAASIEPAELPSDHYSEALARSDRLLSQTASSNWLTVPVRRFESDLMRKMPVARQKDFRN